MLASSRAGVVDYYLERACTAWGSQNNVDVVLNFVSRNDLTAYAYAAAEGAVHADIMSFSTYDVVGFGELLEPVDDLVQEISAELGPYLASVTYIARPDGLWRAIIDPTDSYSLPTVSRLDLWRDYAGIDLEVLFPSGARNQAEIDTYWTYPTFLEAAKKLALAGHPFVDSLNADALGSENWLAPVFLAFGSEFVSTQGEIRIDSEGTRAALEFLRELAAQMPAEAFAWDDAGTDQLLKSSSISGSLTTPIPWFEARAAGLALAAQLWHHDVPAGPAGRFRSSTPAFWGIWADSENKPAAKALLAFLGSREQTERLVEASFGLNMPAIPLLWENPPAVWSEEPSLFNYPIRGDERQIVPGYPAPSPIAARLYQYSFSATLVAYVARGSSVDEAIQWGGDMLDAHLQATGGGGDPCWVISECKCADRSCNAGCCAD
jgi:hypothetical protein